MNSPTVHTKTIENASSSSWISLTFEDAARVDTLFHERMRKRQLWCLLFHSISIERLIEIGGNAAKTILWTFFPFRRKRIVLETFNAVCMLRRQTI